MTDYHKGWNPRYVAYAHANGCTPSGMLVVDAERYPGGKMCGFVLWNEQKWNEFFAAQNIIIRRDRFGTNDRPFLVAELGQEYSEWLLEQYPEPVRDGCEICHGEQGGVPGNENRVNGLVLCDFCHAERLNVR